MAVDAPPDKLHRNSNCTSFTFSVADSCVRLAPMGRSLSLFSSVSDLPTLGRMTIEETRALSHFLTRSGKFGPIVLTGYSSFCAFAPPFLIESCKVQATAWAACTPP